MCPYLYTNTILLIAYGDGQGNTLPAGTTADNDSQSIVTGMADENPQAADALEIESAVKKNTGENSAEGDMAAMPRITISVGEKIYQARLYDNDTARELVGRMPLVL